MSRQFSLASLLAITFCSCVILAIWTQAGSIIALLLAAPLPVVIGALCCSYRKEDPSTVDSIYEDAWMGFYGGYIGAVVACFCGLETMVALWCIDGTATGLLVFISLSHIMLVSSFIASIYPAAVTGLVVGTTWGTVRYFAHRRLRTTRQADASLPADRSEAEPAILPLSRSRGVW